MDPFAAKNTHFSCVGGRSEAGSGVSYFGWIFSKYNFLHRFYIDSQFWNNNGRHDSRLRLRKQLGHGMTYEEAVAMYPHDEVHVQVDGVVRPMTPKEYEAFIQKQVDYIPE
jgi:hypothetical protein